MDPNSPDPPRITAGPRFGAVVDGILRAETALERTNSWEDSSRAWSVTQRLELLNSIRDLHARLRSHPSDRSLFEGFEVLGPSEVEADEELMDAIIDLDLRVGDLETTESSLLMLQTHLADLEDVLRTDKRAIPLESSTQKLFDVADRIVERLLSGSYVVSDELEQWDEAVDSVSSLLTKQPLRNRVLTSHRWLSEFSVVNQMIHDIAHSDARYGQDEAGDDSRPSDTYTGTSDVDPEHEPAVPSSLDYASPSILEEKDPVFPSLHAAGTTVWSPPTEEPIGLGVVAYRFPHNIFTLTTVPAGQTRETFLDTVGRTFAIEDDSAEALDRAERDRVADLGRQFVQLHVRRLTKGAYLKDPNANLRVGSLLVSESPVPRSLLRHAKFQWAITNGQIVDLRNVRVPVGHVAHISPDPETSFGDACRGDLNDVAYLLAVVLDALGVEAPTPIGAVGKIQFGTNELSTIGDIDPYLDAAHASGMHHVVMPRHQARIDGMHAAVRYWPSQDANEAIFSALEAMSGGVVVPNLVRRAFTKSAYAWLSFSLILISIGAYQLAVSLDSGGHPPVSLVRVLLGIVVICCAGSFVFTHRFWRIDR